MKQLEVFSAPPVTIIPLSHVLAVTWSFFLTFSSVYPSLMMSVSSTKISSNSFCISPDMVVFVSRIWPSSLIYPISLLKVYIQNPGPQPLPCNIPWGGFFLDLPKYFSKSQNPVLRLNIIAWISSSSDLTTGRVVPQYCANR